MPGSYDPESGVYVYANDDPYTSTAIGTMLNRLAISVRDAVRAILGRLSTLEGLVGSAYGAIKLSADVTYGPAATVVGFNTTELSSGVTRTSTNLYPATGGVYLATFAFSSTPSASNTWRDVWLERLVAGAWTEIPLSRIQCAMGPSGLGQYAANSVPVSLAAGDGVRMRTQGSTGAATVVVSSVTTNLSLMKVSG